MKITFFKIVRSTLLFVSLLTTSLTSINVLAANGDIVDVASNATQFSTLVSAVKAAELVTTLQGAGPFTVLAPTNEAFAKIPSETLSALLLVDNKAALTKILTYHVISGNVDAAQIVQLTTAKTVEGGNLRIGVVDGKVKLNDSTTVVTTDIKATNGIIHSIDSVLIPSTVDLTKLVKKSSSETVRTGASASPALVILYASMFSALTLIAIKPLFRKI
jgi:uncharacterized surface protein with fasciclin (FAS1) repeats